MTRIQYLRQKGRNKEAEKLLKRKEKRRMQRARNREFFNKNWDTIPLRKLKILYQAHFRNIHVPLNSYLLSKTENEIENEIKNEITKRKKRYKNSLNDRKSAIYSIFEREVAKFIDLSRTVNQYTHKGMAKVIEKIDKERRL